MLLAQRHPQLTAAARTSPISRSSTATALDWAVLLAIGSLTAILTAYLALNLRIPGHAVLRVVAPMVVGLALVPRRGAGTVMSLGAALTGAVIRLSDTGELSAMPFVGLILVGPLLDLAAAGGRSGRELYLRFTSVGVAANLILYGVRWGVMTSGLEAGGGSGNFRRLGFVALGSYAVCGALAGLIGAAIAFRPTSADAPHE